MKKILFILIAFAFVSASVNASKVNNVELLYKDGFTSAVISIDGPVRFTHQTEEAKDGKPFRVIVDVLSATHELGSKNFHELPNCPVKSIRTSQFAVTPEKIVRFVFDMDSDRVYRVDSDNSSVTLFFSDNSTQKFSNWSSSKMTDNQNKNIVPVKTASVTKTEKKVTSINKSSLKTATELNKSINNDRLSSLESSSSTSKRTPKISESKIYKSEQPYGPVLDKNDLALDVKEKQQTKAKKTNLAKIEADKKAKLAQAEADKRAKAEKAKLAKVEAGKKAEADKKAKLAQAETDKKVKADKIAKLAKIEADKRAKAEKVKLAQAKADKKKKSTSRFRRSPSANKINGTMVAQFPKRLVIKYKSKSYRDPFATLIDESKTYNNPVEKKIPNVEGLKLVGIIQAEYKKENRALFEDNDGYGYILKTGDKVRKGYVLRVNSDKVFFQIFEYGWSRTIALNLEG